MLLAVSFFVVFTFTILMTKFDPIWSINKIMFVSMLKIWNLRYLMYYWIIKRVGLESIIFAINMNNVSFFKVFSTLYYVFVSIILLI